MQKKLNYAKHSVLLFSYLFIIWGFYRFLIEFPETIEELILKPILWLVPVFYFLRKEKEGLASIGFTNKNLFKAIYFSLALGSVFAFEALIINFVKYEGFNFNAQVSSTILISAILLSFATAVSEEITFRGYIFTRIYKALDSELSANLISSIGWTLIHLPIAIFSWKLGLTSIIIYSFLTFIFGFGASFIFARTKNIISPILLHVLWQWPIILFR